MKPAIQLYALALDELQGYDKSVNYWEKLMKNSKETNIWQRYKNTIEFVI